MKDEIVVRTFRGDIGGGGFVQGRVVGVTNGWFGSKFVILRDDNFFDEIYVSEAEIVDGEKND